MKISTLFLVLVALSAISGHLVAQSTSDLWRVATVSETNHLQDRWITPQKEQVFHMEPSALQQLLATAPEEFSLPIRQSSLQLSLPMPDGALQQFAVVHSPIAEEGLLKKYPNIRTYAGVGIDDPTATVRFDLTPAGFHAMILSTSGTVFIDPYSPQSNTFYSSYFTRDFTYEGEDWTCHFAEVNDETHSQNEDFGSRFGDCQFRSYRLALAATGEYTNFHGGQAQAIAAQITTMNRVNQVVERDLAIRFIIVANNNLLVYTNPGTDPYSNFNGVTMLGQNQTNVDAVIGSANYDMGHVFSTGGGGIAALGSLCSSANKARGVTGLPAPVGDPFDIDFVAHEMGHQLGGTHTFNGTVGSCGGGNRTLFAAFEPGSGTTIQAYAGICGSQNVQNNSDDYYHAISLEQMANVITNTSCATFLGSSNNPPTVSHGPLSYVIPANTPFFLESAATDVDGDNLTYCWEQFDNEDSPQPPNSSSTGGPLFRSRQPTSDPRRYFPRIQAIVTNSSPTWEVLPSVTREMNFKVTVRDNVVGGCTDSEDALIEVEGSAGPFRVLHPNTVVDWIPNTFETIQWDVANTDLAPVNTPNVDILLSLDAGFTYPITLATQVPNNGSALIQVPDTFSNVCRVMVQGSDNIFFDISDQNFRINTPAQPGFALYWPDTSAVACIDGTGTYTFLSTGWQGLSDSITFSFSSLPAGVSIETIGDPVLPGDTAQVLVTVDSTATAGSYTLALIANAGSASPQSQILTLEISSDVPEAVLPLAPISGASGISTNSTFDWVPVPGALSYQIEIASSPLFDTNVVFTQSGIPSPGYTLPIALATGEVYYWRVLAENSCGFGPFSEVNGFQIGQCTDTASIDVPLTIPLFGTTREVISEVAVTLPGLISDLNVVNLGGTHLEISELTATLINTGTGTEVVLFSGICNPGDQNFQFNFDDQASQATPPCPPIDGGFYQPQGNLSDFNGEQSFGIWQLKIEDSENFNNGDLMSWGLSVCVSPSQPELIKNLGLNTVQWSLDTINNLLLEAQDLTSGPADLVFTVIELPEHGGLLLNGVNLSVGETFTQEDIDMNRFAYLNNGNPAAIDDFRFDVRNAAGGWIGVFTFPIEIQSGINGIGDLTELLQVNVFPNPAQDQVSVEIEGEWRGEVQIQMSTIHGQTVLRESLQKQGAILSERIQLDNWAKGVYLLEVRTEEGRMWEKVVVE